MYKQLTSEQRYTISVLLQKKMSRTFIAQVINVSTSTVSREITRNSNVKGVYDPRQAELKKRRRKSKNPGNHSISAELRSETFRLIREEQWSPEQVSGRLNIEGKKVSKSTIYKLANDAIPHTACPVPSAMVKALEVAGDLGLKRGVTIEFVEDGVEIDI